MAEKQHPKERFAALEREIRQAREHLEDRNDDHWSGGIGDILTDLNEELEEIGSEHEEPHDEAHARLDKVEARLRETQAPRAGAPDTDPASRTDPRTK
jgi:hypothetical protein